MRNSQFEINPINKVENIEDDIIKEICKIAIEEAQSNFKSNISKQSSVDRVRIKILYQLNRIIKED